MTADELCLGFAGTPEIAASILEYLVIHDLTPACVLTQPDRPAGRGRKNRASPVKLVAEKFLIPVFQPASNDELQAIEPLSSLDALVVVAYGLIFPPAVLEKPRHGCINVHMSLLPRWRGAAPIQRAIEAGDKRTGVTVMQMDAGLDTGAILAQRQCPLVEDETSATLHDKLAALGAECLWEVLGLIASGEAVPVPQDESGVTYARKVGKEEAWIDWQRPAIEIERKIRAFNPAPVARAEFGQQTLRIWQARALQQGTGSPPGTITRASNEGIDIATADGVLRLLRVQPPGKRPMDIGDFLNGHPGFFPVEHH